MKQKTRKKTTPKKAATRSKRKNPAHSRFKKRAIQFGEYMISGGVWFWSGYVLIVVLDGPIGLFWANLIGNAVGISLNFILNRLWVFKTKEKENIEHSVVRYVIYTALNAF